MFVVAKIFQWEKKCGKTAHLVRQRVENMEMDNVAVNPGLFFGDIGC